MLPGSWRRGLSGSLATATTTWPWQLACSVTISSICRPRSRFATFIGVRVRLWTSTTREGACPHRGVVRPRGRSGLSVSATELLRARLLLRDVPHPRPRLGLFNAHSRAVVAGGYLACLGEDKIGPVRAAPRRGVLRQFVVQVPLSVCATRQGAKWPQYRERARMPVRVESARAARRSITAVVPHSAALEIRRPLRVQQTAEEGIPPSWVGSPTLAAHVPRRTRR
jgi:hypothetical protein